MGKKPFDSRCRVMKSKVVLKDMGVREMVPENVLLENILLHVQGLNYEKCVHELKDHVGHEALSLNLLLKLGPIKEFLLQFSQSPTKFFLNHILVSLLPTAPFRRGKTRHQWGNRKSKC
jgi:hypothetical protein